MCFFDAYLFSSQVLLALFALVAVASAATPSMSYIATRYIFLILFSLPFMREPPGVILVHPFYKCSRHGEPETFAQLEPYILRPLFSLHIF